MVFGLRAAVFLTVVFLGAVLADFLLTVFFVGFFAGFFLLEADEAGPVFFFFAITMIVTAVGVRLD